MIRVAITLYSSPDGKRLGIERDVITERLNVDVTISLPALDSES